MDERVDVIIIGGGAAGLACGIEVALRGMSCLIIEQKEKLAKKLYATGNGKCNYANRSLTPDTYYCKEREELEHIIREDTPEELVNYFKNLGIHPMSRGQYLYPHSEQASSVVKALSDSYLGLGGNVWLHSKVRDLEYTERLKVYTVRGTTLTEEQKEEEFRINADHVVLATGGKSASKYGSDGSGYKLCEKLGHRITPCVPALTGLWCKGDFERLHGVRAKASLRLLLDNKVVAEDAGEVQFTKYGISGIAVFNLSRLAAYGLHNGQGVTMTLDFLEDLPMQELYDAFIYMREYMPTRSVSDALSGYLPEKLVNAFLMDLRINPSDPLQAVSDRSWKCWYNRCREWKIPVTDTNHFENSQVTAGGVPLSEIYWQTMESKLSPNLHLCGEILDVDGICGGYNLMWAFKTGILAGRGIGS